MPLRRPDSRHVFGAPCGLMAGAGVTEDSPNKISLHPHPHPALYPKTQKTIETLIPTTQHQHARAQPQL